MITDRGSRRQDDYHVLTTVVEQIVGEIARDDISLDGQNGSLSHARRDQLRDSLESIFTPDRSRVRYSNTQARGHVRLSGRPETTTVTASKVRHDTVRCISDAKDPPEARFNHLKRHPSLANSQRRYDAAPLPWNRARQGLKAAAEDEAKSTMRTCVSCAEDMIDGLSQTMTSTCMHEVSACITCVQTWIETQLATQAYNALQCIDTEHKNVLQYEDVKRQAPPEVFQRYDRLSTLAVCNTDPDIFWCLGCDSGQIQVDADDNPLFECQNCYNSYCMRHRVLWHYGETCDAFELRMQSGVLVGQGEGTSDAAARNARASSGSGSGLGGHK